MLLAVLAPASSCEIDLPIRVDGSVTTVARASGTSLLFHNGIQAPRDGSFVILTENQLQVGDPKGLVVEVATSKTSEFITISDVTSYKSTSVVYYYFEGHYVPSSCV